MQKQFDSLVLIFMATFLSLAGADNQEIALSNCFLNDPGQSYPVKLSPLGALALELFHERYVTERLLVEPDTFSHQMKHETRLKIAQYIGAFVNQKIQQGQDQAAANTLIPRVLRNSRLRRKYQEPSERADFA